MRRESEPALNLLRHWPVRMSTTTVTKLWAVSIYIPLLLLLLPFQWVVNFLSEQGYLMILCEPEVQTVSALARVPVKCMVVV